MIFAKRLCERVIIIGVKRSGIGSGFEEALGCREIAARGGNHSPKIKGGINIFSEANRPCEQSVSRFEIGMIVKKFAGVKKDAAESRVLMFSGNETFSG